MKKFPSFHLSNVHVKDQILGRSSLLKIEIESWDSPYIHLLCINSTQPRLRGENARLFHLNVERISDK